MDIQDVVRQVEEAVDAVANIEAEADSKLSTIEDLRERASDINSQLSADLATLLNIEENMENVEQIVSDAEDENIV